MAGFFGAPPQSPTAQGPNLDPQKVQQFSQAFGGPSATPTPAPTQGPNLLQVIAALMTPAPTPPQQGPNLDSNKVQAFQKSLR